MFRTAYQALFVALQYLLPAHFLSHLMHGFTRAQIPWLKNLFCRWLIARFKVDMSEARQSDYRAYASINHFFTRELNPAARPLAHQTGAVLCPVDGAVSQASPINGDSVFQAKKHHYSLTTLLGGSKPLADIFADGLSTTLYLSPRDYHRIHMPLDGTLREVIHVPGKLFSVNRTTTQKVRALFARNERVVCIFDTEAGPMAMVLVGAIFVASIETVWQGEITPPTGTHVQRWDYRDKNIKLQAGEEMGRFNMGSTVIVLFSKDRARWVDSLRPDSAVRMGELMGLY